MTDTHRIKPNHLQRMRRWLQLGIAGTLLACVPLARLSALGNSRLPGHSPVVDRLRVRGKAHSAKPNACAAAWAKRSGWAGVRRTSRLSSTMGYLPSGQAEAGQPHPGGVVRAQAQAGAPRQCDGRNGVGQTDTVRTTDVVRSRYLYCGKVPPARGTFR